MATNYRIKKMDIRQEPFIFRPIGDKLHKVGHKLKLRLQQEIQNNGYSVTPDQVIVLGSLWNDEGLSQNEICAFTTKGKSNVTRIIDNLVKKELAYRETDPRDRRSSKVFLTDSGRNLKNLIYPILQEYFSHAFAGFSDKEFAHFESYLIRVADNLDKMDF